MVAAVTTRRNGRAEMAYTGEVPWHGLGQRLQPGASLDTWITEAGMDWSILRPMVRYPTSAEDVNNPANWRTMEDRVVLIRSDDHEPLGIVSADYKEVQPREVMEFFRDFTEDRGMVMETAGTLFGGKRFWALARCTADQYIRDPKDKVGGFVLLSTSADGTLATEARFTTVRVVCNNTLTAALRGKGAFKLSHRSFFDHDAAKLELGLTREAIAEGFEGTMETFRRLAKKRLSKAEMGRMTLEAFGFDFENMDRKEIEKAIALPTVNTVQTLASTGRGLIGAEFEGAMDTAWGWINAVTQYVDHNPGARSRDNRLNAAWFGKGNDLKTKAFQIAVRNTDGTVTMETVTQENGPSMGDADFAALLSKPVRT